MNTIPEPAKDERLESYHYDLPEELIAKEPRMRGSSRLLVYDRKTQQHSDHMFSELPGLLPPGALLVANNSRVVPARLLGNKPSGGKMECLLLSPLPFLEQTKRLEGGFWTVEAQVLLKPAKGLQQGSSYEFSGLQLVVLEKGEFGQCRVECRWKGDLEQLFARHGLLPLPPYMRRQAENADSEAYQTVFSRLDKLGSVAAPTAGLHFTPQIKASLAEKGFGWVEGTLYVGYGTFSPVRAQDVREHVMHPEYVQLDAESVLRIKQAKEQGRPVIAIGTTSVRLLEGIATAHHGELVAYEGWINMFIRPGYQTKIVDGLLTNFHLPESTLLMLVSALAGREKILELYHEAVQKHYAFFSYGDAMLIR